METMPPNVQLIGSKQKAKSPNAHISHTLPNFNLNLN